MSRVEKVGRGSEIYVFDLKPFRGGGRQGGDYKKIFPPALPS